MSSDVHLTADELAVVARAETTLAGQASISTSEASTRIQLYARFQDMEIADVCQGILDGLIRLLTMSETERCPLQAKN